MLEGLKRDGKTLILLLGSIGLATMLLYYLSGPSDEQTSELQLLYKQQAILADQLQVVKWEAKNHTDQAKRHITQTEILNAEYKKLKQEHDDIYNEQIVPAINNGGTYLPLDQYIQQELGFIGEVESPSTLNDLKETGNGSDLLTGSSTIQQLQMSQ